MRSYFYSLLARYIGLHVRPDDTLVEIDANSNDMGRHFPQRQVVTTADLRQPGAAMPRADYYLLNGGLHYERDIQSYLDLVRKSMPAEARLVVLYYSALWRPFMAIATRLGWREKTREVNWLSHADIDNFLELADFEPLRRESKVLIPIHIPIIAPLVNRYLAPLPLLSSLCMVNVLVARPREKPIDTQPSVSVVVPARNEAGNIEDIIRRLPKMGPHDELIFIEGGSKDDTWARICAARDAYDPRQVGAARILAAKQDGKGKGDAVRKGFAMASNEILMILDADITVPPEDLPKFYAALASGKAEFVNGSRLVYPMEKGAMRFLNLLANKFFALAFSYVLGQRFKDTLCGTKVLTRANYARLAKNRGYFGEFDPFGDFDLIFGAARMGLKVVEVPIVYRERTYGETNISRWRHGALLIAMLGFAARRLKFI